MDWTPVATVITNSNYVFTPIVNGTLFKLKHIRTNSVVKSLKIVIRQAFEDGGVLAFYDYKLIAYKTELDIVLFSLPSGLTNRKLAIKRADNLIEEDWAIEIEQMQIIEGGINLPISISDVTNLQLQLDSIQAELTAKALDLDLDNHVLSTENPHNITLAQLGGESIGTAEGLLIQHELSVNHPTATQAIKGMLSAIDKGRLDSMANNATFNESNAYLLDRSKHLGEQPINTITSLIGILDTIDIRLDSKASNSSLVSHVIDTNNPHNVTANQIGAELEGSSASAVVQHESTVNHPIATTSNKGMFSSEDKTKLNSIQNFATLNSSDTYLLNRNNHIGEQSLSTIANLISILTTFVNLTGNQEIAGVKLFSNLIYAAQHIISNSYISAINYYFGNSPLSVEIVRFITGQNHYCAEIGNFDIGNGGVSFRLSLVISDANFSLAKTYTVVTTYQATDTGWLRLVPEKESIYIYYNDCQIDIRISQGSTYLRVRRFGGDGNVGNAVVRVEFTGARYTYFQESYEAVIDSSVVGTY